ncbi:MAG: chain length determinant protein EpsF [Rhodocyclaceae bacterium]|nr:MAG: chain length determinant protein EpsF [Rhodocyclaceae bacterium]
MTPQQFFLVLLARRKLVLIVFLVTAAVGTVVTLLMPKLYTASVSVVVDVKTDPIAGIAQPAMASPAYMSTQTEIIQSDRVAARVVKLMHFDQSPAVVQSWRQETEGKTPFDYYYGALLQKSLVVKPFKGNNIISLSYAARDPQSAAAIANAFVQAYIDTTIDLRVEPARQYAAWFDERLTSLRTTLEKAQKRLSSYQQENGIVATDERVDQETARLNALTQQLSEIQGQKVDAATREKNSGSELSPDVAQNPLIQGLKSDISRAETKLDEISSNVGRNHPQRLQLEAQIAGLKQQLSEEIRRISGTAATANRVTVQKESELRALIEEQKKKVLALRSQHDEIAVLVKDVETAQHAYEAVSQRMSQLSLESKSEQTNISVLSPAVPPTEPSRPVLMKSIMASLGGGLMLGIVLAMAVELMDRRVRNASDLMVADLVPLLGALTPEPKQYTVKERLAIAWSFLRNIRKRPWRMLPENA